tara:strand:- start:36 stop:452 length:417 start_codon:yes stop_codon:yes gene_type:complete
MKYFKIIIIVLLFHNNLLAKTNYFDEGLSHYKKNEFEKAKFKFEQDLVFNPQSENAYLYLSKIFNAQKKKELEEQNLNAVILINPKNEEALYNLANLKLTKSDYLESEKLINQLLTLCKSFCIKGKKLKIEIKKSLKK